MIVGGCAVLSLTLIVLGIFALRGPASRWAAEAMREGQEQAIAREEARENEVSDAPWAKVDGEIPVDVAEGPPPPTTTRPIGSPASWIGPDDYPPSALRNGDEGRVRVTVSADKNGAPLGCAVAETSGHWALDNATCAAMLNKGRFEPGPVGVGGRQHWTSPPIRWQLPD